MLPAAPSERVRVGVLGEGADARDWLDGFASPAMELLHVRDVATLLGSGVDRGVVFASPSEAASISAELAQQPGAPPVTIFVTPGGRAHPEARVAHAVLQAKREWETTFDALVDPLAIVDAAGVITRANQALARLLGVPVREVVGGRIAELLGEARNGRDPISESLADALPRTREVAFARVAGIWQVTTSPLPAGNAGSALVVGLKDMTLVRVQQERILQSARLADIGQLAGGVAHEINTPLASIALRAESLLRAAADERLQAIDTFRNFPRYLKTIDEEIFRCKKIIGALLDFSRVRPPQVRPTDINAIAEKAVDLFAHQLKLRQVELVFQPTPGLPLIQADDGQLRQALIALLMNAMDATRAGGRILVQTADEGDGRVSLSVSDDGIGIPRDIRDKVFTPFFTTKTLGQGTGLGLSICHGIVAAHGGEARMESEEGEGARFTLVLPVERAAQREEPA